VRGAERLYPIFRFKWHASPHGSLFAVVTGGAPQDCDPRRSEQPD
jgi:hypothetical protein